jgi:hypothetical protein
MSILLLSTGAEPYLNDGQNGIESRFYLQSCPVVNNVQIGLFYFTAVFLGSISTQSLPMAKGRQICATGSFSHSTLSIDGRLTLYCSYYMQAASL